jgi:hypothetical protein
MEKKSQLSAKIFSCFESTIIDIRKLAHVWNIKELNKLFPRGALNQEINNFHSFFRCVVGWKKGGKYGISFGFQDDDTWLMHPGVIHKWRMMKSDNLQYTRLTRWIAGTIVPTRPSVSYWRFDVWVCYILCDVK